MTGHLGYDKHDPAGRGSGNNRTTPKTVLTDVGAVDLAVPRTGPGRSSRGACLGGSRSMVACPATGAG